MKEALLPPHSRRKLDLQRAIARLLSPITTPAVYVLLHGWLGLRLVDDGQPRRVFRELRRDSAPLLICANHLTMIDSALIAWALGSPAWWLRNFRALPWNVPEERNFASTWPRRVLAYLYKCVPIARGGSRGKVAETLDRITHLLASGDVALIFPEAGRSRTGRVEVERAAYGVGRVVKALPGCRVLCVYLRGDEQQGYSTLPVRDDRVRVSVEAFDPKSDFAGLRASRDIARQITSKLAEMEREHFAARSLEREPFDA